MDFIKDFANSLKGEEKPKEEVPDLVNDFEEVSKQN